MLCIDGVKCLPRVSWGQPEANLLKMPYGYQGSTRGQLKCIGPSNAANATEHYAAAGALVFLTQRRRGLERLFKMRGLQGGRGWVSRQSQRMRGVVATFSVLRKH